MIFYFPVQIFPSEVTILNKNDAKMDILTLAPAGIFSGGPRSTKGGLVRGSPRGGFGGRSPPDAREVFKKFVKKAMKNYNF